jgi:hypothetical protein
MWKGERQRHSASSRGIKTTQEQPNPTRIRFYRGGQKAEIVLTILKELLEGNEYDAFKWRDTVYVVPFVNGRETGYAVYISGLHLPLKTKTYFFTEHRSSDDIRVTTSINNPTAEWSGVTESDYENSKYFNFDEYHKVAKYIAKQLEQDMIRTREDSI